MKNRVRQIVREEIQNQLLMQEMVNNIVKKVMMTEDEKKHKNNKQEDYVAKHGHKEQNAMRGQVTKAADSDAINNAAIARQMERDHPGMKIDSSYISKMTHNKPGYTSGHYHWDKEKADAYLQAKDELGVN